MKPKGKPKVKSGSKIPTTSINTNKKKADNPSGAKTGTKKIDKAFLKKNEFALILMGALLLTIIIFFIFFRSSDNSVKSVVSDSPGSSFVALEKRIEALETALKIVEKTNKTGAMENKKKSDTDSLESRVVRLETAVLIKFESLIERMDRFEKKIGTGTLKNKIIASKPVAAKPKTVSPPVKKKAIATVKKTTKKASMFHTVQKKETLWSISKKYKTTVAALKKLNNLSEKDKIYPGDNIIVK